MTDPDITGSLQTDKPLPQSEALLLKVFGKCPVAVSVHRWDDGIIVDVNEAFSALTGWSRDKVIGRSMVELNIADAETGVKFRAHLEKYKTLDNAETDITTLGGAIRNVLVGMVLVDMLGEMHAVATFVDITERKRKESELRGSHTRLEAIIQTEPECVKLLAADGSLLEMNPAGLRMIEADDLADVKNQPLYGLVVAEYRPAFRRLTKKVFRGESGILEFQIVGLKGTPRWLETHASPLRDADGKVSALLGITRDVTEHKQAEALVTCQTKVLEKIAVGAPLTDSLDTLLRLLEGFAPGLLCSILVLDADGTTLHHCSAPSLPESFTNAIDGEPIGPNAGSCGTAAFRREQVVVEDIATDPLWADYRDIAMEHGLGACWSTPIFDDQQRLSGTFAIYYRQPGLPTELDRRCIDLATNLAAIAINRQRSEATLHESEARTQLLVKSSNIGLWDWNLITNEVYFSPEWKQQLGHTDDDLPNRYEEWESRLHPDDREPTLAGTIGFREGKREYYDREFRMRHNDGSWRWILTRADLFRDPEGVPVRMMGCHVDITERKQAENALRESEERFSTIFKAAPGSMMLFSMPEGKTVEVNDNFSIITGYTREEALGKSTAELGMWADPQARERMLALVEKNGTVSNFEADLRHRSGTIRNGLVSGHSLSIQDKNYLLGVFNDITELKQTEKERQVIFEIIQGSITTRNLDEFLKLVHRLIGQIVYAENCFVMLHEPADDMVHFEFWADKYDPPPPPHLARKGFSNYVLRTAKPLLLTDELAKQMQASGEADLVDSASPSWLGVPLRTPEKTIGVLVLQHYENHDAFSERDLQFIASVGDQIALAIERKWAEDAVKESEERYRELVENAIDIIYTHDLKGNYTSVNKAGEVITGYTAGESLKMNLADTVAPEYLEKAMEMIGAKLADKDVTAYELEIIAKDGHRVAVEVNTRIILENSVPVGVQGIARDVTERKRGEEVLQETRRRVEDIVHTVDGIVWEADAQTFAFTFVSKQAEQILGYPTERWLDDPTFWSEHIHPEDRDFVVEFCKDSTNSLTPHQFEYRMLAQDGREVWLKDVVTILAEAGRPVKLRGIMMDITERKRVDDELRESEQKYRSILDNIEDGYFEVDVAGNLTFFNDSLCGIFGYSHKELLGMNNRTFMDDENARKVYQTFNKVYQTGIPAKAFDWEIIRKDGTMRFIEASVSQRKDSADQPIGFRGVLRDITARKWAEEALRSSEEQLRQSQKMEAVGLLAGGVAHDFNNLLTAISGYSQLSLRKLPTDDPIRSNIEEIAKAGERAAELTRQLLAFSRKQILTPAVHNLNSVVLEIEKMLRRLIRANVELRTVLDPELGNIKADPGQIERVIVNLAVNARDAMPKGGTLTIETQNIEIGQEYVSTHPALEPGQYVKMTVTDTGEGMDEKTRSRIFEPFFTTKAMGSGTGLGLSTVHGIVSQSGGDIQVYSEPGHGTTFKVYLPCVDEAVQKPRWRDEMPEDLSGTETILLVEDEDVVRGLVRESLVEKGYTVFEAASGKDALSICSTSADPIDLLFTDVVMPKMSGDELSVQIIELRPDIKVLFMSGYTDESVVHRGIIESNAPFIEKPCTPDAIARKVRQVLDS